MIYKNQKSNYSYNHIPEKADEYTIKKIFDRAYTKALRYLTIRNRSKKEIKDYLSSKEFDTTTIEPVIELLTSQKFLNDSDFAEWWIRGRQNSKAKSKSIIKMELRAKGVSDEIIEECLTDSQDDYTTALQYFEKKKRRFEKYKGNEYFQKAASFLQRRGFSWDVVKKVLKEEK